MCAGVSLTALGLADGRFTALRSVGFEVQLDQLQADDCPKYLTKCLEFTLKEFESHKRYGLNLETEGAEGLLEVFDKVRQRSLYECTYDADIV